MKGNLLPCKPGRLLPVASNGRQLLVLGERLDRLRPQLPGEELALQGAASLSTGNGLGVRAAVGAATAERKRRSICIS